LIPKPQQRAKHPPIVPIGEVQNLTKKGHPPPSKCGGSLTTKNAKEEIKHPSHGGSGLVLGENQKKREKNKKLHQRKGWTRLQENTNQAPLVKKKKNRNRSKITCRGEEKE